MTRKHRSETNQCEQVFGEHVYSNTYIRMKNTKPCLDMKKTVREKNYLQHADTMFIPMKAPTYGVRLYLSAVVRFIENLITTGADLRFS